jgi:hypothetical protein
MHDKGVHVPSFRIETPTVSLSVFDVVGADGDQPRFISHTGLAESEGAHKVDAVKILDMGPPLRGPGTTTAVKATAAGRAELTDDEQQKIRSFVNQHVSEHESFLQLNERQILRLAPQMYCIYPHATPLAEDDDRYVRMRFSCSGFVYEAYRSARISLLDVGTLPPVDMAVIKVAYPAQTRLMESERLTPESLGLEGEGPWPVMLCGYLLHALNRPADLIRQQPYTPVAEDQHFPREPAESVKDTTGM